MKRVEKAVLKVMLKFRPLREFIAEQVWWARAEGRDAGFTDGVKYGVRGAREYDEMKAHRKAAGE